ncbi:MAG: hypothetical protein ACD_62C00128G0002 [uncultured bacterium]|nr:MAG: hypothetical protein ACD_62C00128G0002 [uncultured bacterium]
MKNYSIIIFFIIFLCIPIMGFCGDDQGNDPFGEDDLVSPDEVDIDLLVDQNEDGEAPEKGHVHMQEAEEEEENGGGGGDLGSGKEDFQTIDGGTTDELFDDIDYEEFCWKYYHMSCSEWYFSQLEGHGDGLLSTDSTTTRKTIIDAIIRNYRESGIGVGVEGYTPPGSNEADGYNQLDTTPAGEPGGGTITGITIDFMKIFKSKRK